VAPVATPVEPAKPKMSMTEFMREREASLKKIWGGKPVDIDTTALISEGRDRDFLS
jgi:hypothetical protein